MEILARDVKLSNRVLFYILTNLQRCGACRALAYAVDKGIFRVFSRSIFQSINVWIGQLRKATVYLHAVMGFVKGKLIFS